MSVALHGNLRDFGIAEVFQLIGQQRKTGTLEVVGEDQSTFLAFDNGRVVRGGSVPSRSEREPLASQLVRSGYLTREQLENVERESARSARPIADLLLSAGLIEEQTLAEVQHLLTRETVFDVMRRKSGDFHFTAEGIQHDTKPENLLGAEQILMDGLRMLDEWLTFVTIVPNEDMVFRRVGKHEAARELTQGHGDDRSGDIERVLQLVDGRLSVRRIIDLSRIGTFEATRALAELCEAGVIEEVEPADRKQAPMPVARNRPPILKMLRAAIATTLPFVALIALGVVATERVDATENLRGTPIPDPTISSMGARHERLLIRNLLEAHFFEHGAYPQSLGAVSIQLADAGVSLTASQLGAYYYQVRGDEVILLPPMN